EFLVIYGDSYLPIDYPGVLGHLGNDTAAVGVTVVYDNSEPTAVPNNIALDDAGYVARYAKDLQHAPALRYVDAGVLAFRRSIVNFLPAGRPVSLEKDVFPE